nr:hypothetical protein [Klebsiella pneumoniae]
MTKEETWLKEQIEETFSRVDKGEIRYYSEDEADERMNSFISKIEHQHENRIKKAAIRRFFMPLFTITP